MTLFDLADRVRIGRARGRVAFGRDRFFSLAKRKQVAMVWIMDDFSDQATAKFIIECQKAGVPVVKGGSCDEIGLVTGEPSVKVYLLKAGFPGLPVILRDLKTAGLLYSDDDEEEVADS
jgi:ribosomal protein L7Ae-like RNA K-turn-binding protein